MAQNTQIKHSSHPHLLQLSPSNQQINLNCAGCNLHISPNDHVYTCRPCNFFLHMSCSKFPQLITHPSHREHALSLISTPIYPGGFFKCDACTQHGTRFSYHCHTCDFDLHVLCSSKPLSVNTHVHPHPLVLTFSSPYGEKMGFSCDVCKNAGLSGQWLYRCVPCEFDVHLDCATSKMQHGLQHNLSFPGAAPVAHPNQYVVAGQPLMHSLSTGHAPTNWQTQQQQHYAPAGGFQPYQQPSQPQPQLQPYQMGPQPPQPVGFVDGMMQQLGQDFVQGLTGGGDGGGGGGGGDAGGGFSFECSAE
ncbi:C1-like protein [Artemisia annua]|uniref:C1-like protein n=1 Tax=Artemisia annua TaxID=35608 RepID=A0A2U1KK36_ARTAN|nr:C1-like protein [Artemisia annua]